MGLPDLKTIRDRCDDDGGCWIWRDACNSQGYPQMSVNGRGGQMVRRLAYELSGRTVLPGRAITSRCDRRQCCNPEHLKQKTFGQVLKHTYATGARVHHMEYAARRDRAISQGWAKLSMPIARQIRMDERGVEELAAAWNVHPKTIRKIKAGLMWREAAPNSSVFHMAA